MIDEDFYTYREKIGYAIDGKYCVDCEKSLPDYEVQYCCTGHECGCQGLPINPPICDECFAKYDIKPIEPKSISDITRDLING